MDELGIFNVSSNKFSSKELTRSCRPLHVESKGRFHTLPFVQHPKGLVSGGMNVAVCVFQAATDRWSMSPEEKIRAKLAGVRARLNRAGMAEACAVGVMILSFSLAITILVAAAAGPTFAGWAIAPLSIGLWATWIFVRRLWLLPRRKLSSDEAVARWCEARFEETGADLITAVQLQDAKNPNHSQALSKAVISRAAQHLTAQDWTQVGTHGRHSWLGAMGALSLVFLIALGLLFPRVINQAYANLFDPLSAGSTSAGLEVIERVSVIEDEAVDIQSPTYTGRALRHVDGSRGRIKALTGSTALIVGRSAIPASRVLLILESDPEGRWPVVLGANDVIKATMRVGESDRYKFAVVGLDGRVYLETVWRDVIAETDAPPTLKLLKPTSDVQVHPGDQTAVSVDVVDDFGIESVELVIELPRGKPTRRVLDVGNGARELQTEAVVRVDDLNLLPGEVATVYAEAKDRNNVTDDGVGRSGSFRILMANPEAEHEEFLLQLTKLMDALIDLLANRLESPVDDDERADLSTLLDWHSGIVEAQSVLLRFVGDLIAGVGDTTPRKEEISSLLKSTLDQLEAVLSSEKRQLSRIRDRDFSSPRPAVQRALLRTVNTDGISQKEAAIFQLKDWIDRSRQDNVMERGREMLSLQNELHDLLERLKEHGDPALAQDAQRHLDQLENHLRQMEDQMSKLAERVPYENQNAPTKPSDNAVDMQSMRDRIAEAKRLIREGKIDEAMKLLEDLNTDTQQMMARLSDEFKTGQPRTAKGSEELSKLQSALRKLQGGQQSLLDETGESLQSQKAEAVKAFKEKFDELQAKADELKNRLESVDGSSLHPSDGQRLRDMTERAKQVVKDLAEADVDAAQRGASEVGDGAQSLRSEIGRSEERELDLKRQASLREAMKGLKEGQGQARELAEALDDLKEDLSKMRSSPEGRKQAQRFKKLGKKQGRLGKTTGKLQKALRDLDAEVPGIEQHLAPELEAARRSMEQAMQKLKGQKGEAQGHQRDALDQLGKVLKGLEEKMKQDPRSDGTTGPNDPREKVAIPDAEAYEVPKEFREELLRAMKERAPKKFDKENKRFYEELVK